MIEHIQNFLDIYLYYILFAFSIFTIIVVLIGAIWLCKEFFCIIKEKTIQIYRKIRGIETPRIRFSTLPYDAFYKAANSAIASIEQENLRILTKKEGIKMINVEGYKAFKGKMKITPKSGVEPFILECDWLYKPDTKCWYGCGRSFAESICEVIEEY